MPEVPPRLPLTLGNLRHLDLGRVDSALSQEIERAVEDLKDRPAVDGARKVVLTIEMKPISEDGGSLDRVSVRMHVALKCPKRSTIEYSMRPQGKALVFSTDSPDNVEQLSLREAQKGGE